jgi:N-acylglucosamine-6-phosphate 2-epimerase
MPLHHPFSDWFAGLQGKLIVSCQALEDEALFGSTFMARMALAVKMGGAAAIRANTPQDVQAIRQTVDLPIFALYKAWIPGYEVYLTPTVNHAVQIAQAGADVICVDATHRPRPDGTMLDGFFSQIHRKTGLPILADVSTLEEGLTAQACGSEMVSTALAGYTPYSRQIAGPDFDLLDELVRYLNIPVLAEGRYHYPQQAAEAVQRGAYAVVVGGAITRPTEITTRFIDALQTHSSSQKPE